MNVNESISVLEAQITELIKGVDMDWLETALRHERQRRIQVATELISSKVSAIENKVNDLVETMMGVK